MPVAIVTSSDGLIGSATARRLAGAGCVPTTPREVPGDDAERRAAMTS